MNNGEENRTKNWHFQQSENSQHLRSSKQRDEGFPFPCACSMSVFLCSIHTSVSIDVSEEKSRDESF
jgi:hypothetical protein